MRTLRQNATKGTGEGRTNRAACASSGGTVLVDARAAKKARDRILRQYHAPADRSPDLLR